MIRSDITGRADGFGLGALAKLGELRASGQGTLLDSRQSL